MRVAHPENDIRQPLFAVFAAPFVGIPYLLGRLSDSASVQAMLLNIIQVVMLFTANFMLAKMMKLNSVKRICFMLLTSFTYANLLFTLMMEQYMVAYFWLIFCAYNIVEKQKPDRLALWGAGGTLLTSMLLLLFISDQNPIKNFKKWFADMVRYGLEFVAVILVFCRFDVIFNLISRIKLLSVFSGKTITFTDKLYQYIAFISDYFVSPDAAVKNIIPNYFAFHVNLEEHLSWQLNPVTSINFLGVALILLAIISAVLNRNKKSSLIASVWAAFSVVMLLILGWGTAENGLILYSLYFGWAFLVLLFQLVEKLEDKLKVKFLVPSFSIVGAAVLAIVLLLICVVCNQLIFYIPSALLLLLYFVLNLAYSFGLKNIPILDVTILVSGFLIRIIYGAYVTEITISNWLYLTVIALSFYFALGKRRNELMQNGDGETRQVLKAYSVNFLDKNMVMCLTLANVFYVLWSKDEKTMEFYDNEHLIFTVPIVLLITMKYSLDIEKGANGDPIEVLLHDKVLLAMCFLYLTAMFVILYL